MELRAPIADLEQPVSYPPNNIINVLPQTFRLQRGFRLASDWPISSTNRCRWKVTVDGRHFSRLLILNCKPFFIYLWQVYLNPYHATLGYLCWLTSQTVALTWYCTHQYDYIITSGGLRAESAETPQTLVVFFFFLQAFAPAHFLTDKIRCCLPEARAFIYMFSVGGPVWGTLWVDSNLFS